MAICQHFAAHGDHAFFLGDNEANEFCHTNALVISIVDLEDLSIELENRDGMDRALGHLEMTPSCPIPTG